ncbi:hypothetical protein ACMDCT_15670 [Halomonadaceae bacterium KBTZ08]
MRNRWILALGLSALTGMATHAVAQQDPFIEMMKAQSKDSCSDPALLDCLGVDTATCKKSMETTIDTCADQVSDLSTQAFSECQRNRLSSKLGVTKKQMKACGDKHDDSHARSQPQSPQAAQKNANKAMQKMAKAAQKAAGNVPKSRVTLPIYPNHEVLAHYPSSSMMMSNEETFGENPVSVIKLTTSDSPSEVIAFYRDKLSGFDEAGDPEVLYTFAKGNAPGVKEQSPSARIKEMAQKEHVSISTTGGKTHIEIGYRR